jgi:adenylate cyclase
VTVRLRTAIIAALLLCIIPGAILFNVSWWRTANGVGRDLVDVLSDQITDSVQRAWWGRVAEVQGLARALHAAAAALNGKAAREQALVGAMASTQALSWLVFVDAGGSATALEATGGGRIRLRHVTADGRVGRVADVGPDGILHEQVEVEPEAADVTWLSEARRLDEPGWLNVAMVPTGMGRAVAYVDPTGGNIVAAMIGYDNFATLLGAIPVGRTGRSYVLGPDGRIVIASRAPALPASEPLNRVAAAAGQIIAGRTRDGLNVSEKVRLVVDGADYAVGLSPLWFRGWQLAVVVPEGEFLGKIEATILRVAAALAAFVTMLAWGGALSAHYLLAKPIARIVEDLGHVERFDLELVSNRRSSLHELNRVSEAILRMSDSLADFAKFIPTDLVRGLVSHGRRAAPGGHRREVTVMFADLAGFTALTERLGDDVVPFVGSFLEMASASVAAAAGTVDKFIGDAVMAFWGAPNDDESQALNACRAALSISTGIRNLAPPSGSEERPRVRVGLLSGPAIVGNVGSSSRMNYTALGNVVNLASRIEALNKLYGTDILIGASTRAQAGDAIVVREVDTVVVYGGLEELTVFELISLQTGGPRPEWVILYENALAAYRAGDYRSSRRILATVDALRSGDGPSLWLAALCEGIEARASRPLRAVTILDAK